MTVCERCGYKGNDDYFTTVRHYEREDIIEDLCLDCFFKEYDYCGDCGRAVPVEFLYETDGGQYCEKCYPYYADGE